MVHPMYHRLWFLSLGVQFFGLTVVATDSSVTYSRGDKDVYLAALGHEHDTSYDPSHMKHLRKQINIKTQPKFNYDDPQKCSLYLAESSIPNAGMGMFTTVPYSTNEMIGHSEVGILMHDADHHYPNSNYSKDLFENYVWGKNMLTDGIFEANTGKCMLPGVGMMANDFSGLTNMRQQEFSPRKNWQDGDDSLAIEGGKHEIRTDAGKGASSSHSGVRIEATKNIRPGDELFAHYGAQWFYARQEKFGDIPTVEQYPKAYDIVKQFMNNAEKDGLKISDLGMQQRYEERIYKADWLKDKPRLKAALPEQVSDIPHLLNIGAAAFSYEKSCNLRSVEWIEENGICLDQIVAGASTIPQAGRGAFATRAIEKGANIVTTPVITMTLNQLKLRKVLWGDDWSRFVVHDGFQLLVNYCYGHELSTLVFFPAAPAVNFINHAKDANAEIRWSSSPHHKAEWLDIPFSLMQNKTTSGLFFDIVATKPIARGDEILLYYGNEWEKGWDLHVEDVGTDANFTDMLGAQTAQDYNQKENDDALRTIYEQKINPYPDYITTACYFVPPEHCSAPTDIVEGVKCRVNSDYTMIKHNNHFRHCDILSRHHGEDGEIWYTANVTVVSKKEMGETEKRAKAAKSLEISEFYLVEYLPRYAIRFVNKPYTKDQYAKSAFRSLIKLPYGMMPEKWMNLMNRT